MAETMMRELPFVGIHNFRDYGGYASSHGGRVRMGRLYRSAQHRDATPADLDAVAALDLATVIDLRGGKERRVAPCPRPAGFAAQVLFEDEETAGLAPHIEAARSVTDPEDAREAMRGGYAVMPFRPVLVKIMARYFETLATVDGPTLIHCMAGKDRTGIAVALAHRLLGVHHDDIIADYMLTNRAGRPEERIAAGARVVRAAYGSEMTDDAVRVLMTVDPSYLDAAFDSIGERYGSVEIYMRDVLDVDTARRDAIIGKLVA
jgi:protein tyrosine/serine phosphatase